MLKHLLIGIGKIYLIKNRSIKKINEVCPNYPNNGYSPGEYKDDKKLEALREN